MSVRHAVASPTSSVLATDSPAVYGVSGSSGGSGVLGNFMARKEFSTLPLSPHIKGAGQRRSQPGGGVRVCCEVFVGKELPRFPVHPGSAPTWARRTQQKR